MIIIDSSALMAIVRAENRAEDCVAVLARESYTAIAAPTLTEVLIVAMGRNLETQMRDLIGRLAPLVVPLTATLAESAATAYRQWGKGFHPAALNFGDCFSYAAAKAQDCPLLYVGDDFARTDIASAL